jgi:hypothetical protein
MAVGIVGRVLRANTKGFACGTHSTYISEQHDFGAFVRASIANNPRIQAIGLIYTVEIEEDALVSELVMSEGVNQSILLDQRENRMIPVQIKVLHIGYIDSGRVVHSLPPRPPISLDDVHLCTPEEIYQFTARCDFFRLVLNASDVPSDDLLAAAIRDAAAVYPAAERYDFLVRCGQHVARLLGGDLKRLSHILALINPDL